MRNPVMVVLLGLGLVGEAGAQSLANRIAATENGEVRLAFTAREGICGDGRTFIRDRERDNYISMGDGGSGRGRGWRDRVCDDGPVRVSIRFSDGRIRSVRTYVGGDWSYQRTPTGPVKDLEEVAAPAAATALLALARRSELGDGDDLIFPRPSRTAL